MANESNTSTKNVKIDVKLTGIQALNELSTKLNELVAGSVAVTSSIATLSENLTKMGGNTKAFNNLLSSLTPLVNKTGTFVTKLQNTSKIMGEASKNAGLLTSNLKKLGNASTLSGVTKLSDALIVMTGRGNTLSKFSRTLGVAAPNVKALSGSFRSLTSSVKTFNDEKTLSGIKSFDAYLRSITSKDGALVQTSSRLTQLASSFKVIADSIKVVNSEIRSLQGAERRAFYKQYRKAMGKTTSGTVIVPEETLGSKEEQDTQANTTFFGKAGGGVKSLLSGVGNKALRLAGWYSGAVIAQQAIETVKSLGDLEDSFAKIQAVAGVTSGTMNQVASTIYEVGSNSKFTTQELAQASLTLAQAGFSAGQINEVLDSVNKLAVATGSTLQTSVDVLTTVLSVWNKEASESTHVIDALTTVLNKSKADINTIANGLQYAGSAAAQMNIDFEETVAVMGAMTNGGIKARGAIGTGMRAVITELTKPTDRLNRELAKLGLTFDDVSIRGKGWREVLKTLKDSGITTEAIFRGFERRAATALTTMLSQMDSINEMMTAMNTAGVVAEGYDKQMDTLWSQMKRFANICVEVLSVFQPVVDLFKVAMKVVNGFGEWIARGASELRKLYEGYVLLLKPLELAKRDLEAAQGAMDELNGIGEALAKTFGDLATQQKLLTSDSVALGEAALGVSKKFGQHISINQKLASSYKELNDQVVSLLKSEKEAEVTNIKQNTEPALRTLRKRQAENATRIIKDVLSRRDVTGSDSLRSLFSMFDSVGKASFLSGKPLRSIEGRKILTNFVGNLTAEQESTIRDLSNKVRNPDEKAVFSEIIKLIDLNHQYVELVRGFVKTQEESSQIEPTGRMILDLNVESDQATLSEIKQDKTLSSEELLKKLLDLLTSGEKKQEVLNKISAKGDVFSVMTEKPSTIISNVLNGIQDIASDQIKKLEDEYRQLQKESKALSDQEKALTADEYDKLRTDLLKRFERNLNLSQGFEKLLNDALKEQNEALEKRKEEEVKALKIQTTTTEIIKRYNDLTKFESYELMKKRYSALAQSNKLEQDERERALRASTYSASLSRYQSNTGNAPSSSLSNYIQAMDALAKPRYLEEEKYNRLFKQRDLEEQWSQLGDDIESVNDRLIKFKDEVEKLEKGSYDYIKVQEQITKLEKEREELFIKQEEVDSELTKAFEEQANAVKNLDLEKNLGAFNAWLSKIYLKGKDLNVWVDTVGGVLDSLTSTFTQALIDIAKGGSDMGELLKNLGYQITEIVINNVMNKVLSNIAATLLGESVTMTANMNVQAGNVQLSAGVVNVIGSSGGSAGSSVASAVASTFANTLGTSVSKGGVRIPSGWFRGDSVSNYTAPTTPTVTNLGSLPKLKLSIGGFVAGGRQNVDSVPAMLTPGEFVLSKKAVSALGKDTLDKLNTNATTTESKAGKELNGVSVQKKPSPVVTNVYVVDKEESAKIGPNDIVAAISRDMKQGGETRKLVQQIIQNRY